MSKQASNIFEGSWDIIRSEIYSDSGTWELYHSYEQDELWWEFLPAERYDINTLIRFEGTLTEHNRDYNDDQTKYCFDVDDKEEILIVDRSHYLEDGFLDICEEEWFTLEPTSDDTQTYYLNLINEPDCPPPFLRYVIMRRK